MNGIPNLGDLQTPDPGIYRFFNRNTVYVRQGGPDPHQRVEEVRIREVKTSASL